MPQPRDVAKSVVISLRIYLKSAPLLTGTSLGNNARKFLENRLKSIAHNLEVKVAYRPNEVNEDRMSYELLTELKGKLKRAKCVELTSNPIIDRLINSMNIGNKDSHDHFSAMAFGDIKAFWQDIKEL